MINRMKKAILTTVVLLAAMPLGISAAFQYAPVSVEIPVSADFGGTIVISTEDGLPLPENTEIKVADGETLKYTITFTEPVSGKYMIEQIKGTDSSISYDETVFTVHVLVNGETDILEPVIVLDRGEAEKPAEVHFANTRIPDHSENTGVTAPFKDTVIMVSAIIALFFVILLLAKERRTEKQ